MAGFAYDQVQYQSYPYRDSHPERLYTLAKLFGLNPTLYNKARILELGCASGGNIIPIAYNYPNCKIVGIDLSEKQIQSGKDSIEALKLSNIELFTLSILDIDKSLGQFDYIICHGVYSWVSKVVQHKILAIFRDHLAPQGVAYISYNTYPGWSGVQSIRDMMLFHTKNLESPQDKATQARALLQFLGQGLADEGTPYSQFLGQEIELLKNQPDSYLLHDHLEEINLPTYFHTFMESASQHQLDYLSDTKLNAMFAGNLPEKTAKLFGGITNIIRSNQYIDFIRNQRFRATLLCLNSVKLSRALKTEQIEDFYISYLGMYSQTPTDEHKILTEGIPLEFKGAGVTLTLTHVLSKIALTLLQAQNQVPILYSDFVVKLKESVEAYELPFDNASINLHLKNELNFMRLVFGGIIELHSAPALYTLKYCDTPDITPFVKEQIKAGAMVTNQRHEVIKLSEIERLILKTLDGKTTQAQTIAQLCEKVERGECTILDEQQNKLTDKKAIKAKITQWCVQHYEKLAKQALFVQ